MGHLVRSAELVFQSSNDVIGMSDLVDLWVIKIKKAEQCTKNEVRKGLWAFFLEC